MIEGYETTIIAAVVIALGFMTWLIIRSRRNSHESDVTQQSWTRTDGQMLKLMEAGNLVLTQYASSGRLEYISPEIKRITGIGSADFISGRRQLSELVHPEDAEALYSLEEARSRGDGEHDAIDCRIQDQRNTWHWLHIQQRRIVHGNEIVGFETISVDYTALAELKAQRKRATKLQKLSTQILESFLATDDTRATLSWNLEQIAEELQITEATIHDFENPDETGLLSSWRTTDRTSEKLTARPLTASESEQVRTTCEGLTPIRFGSDSGHDSAGTQQLCADDGELTGVIVPVQVLGKLSLVLTFVRDRHKAWHADEISALQLIAQSISRRLEREHAVQERTHFDEITRGHERSEIIAHLASGIAHDFNNIVFAISGRVQLLQRRIEDQKTNESLHEIQMTLKGAKGLIGALLAMHKGSPRPTGRVRIGPEVKAVMAMIRRLIPRRIELTLDAQDIGDVEVEIGAESLHQILMNLVINARDAIDNKGRIALTITRTIDRHDTPMLTIDVDDDGPGIPESRRAEVFQPFVTSKSSGRGTGLGLSIVQRVILESGGDISLEESPMGGLRVHIGLRIASGEHAHAPDSESSGQRAALSVKKRLDRVLIVEDDETIKALLTRFFQSIGAAVTSHGDAREVEASLRETTPPFDVLVMDIDLPYKTGVECIQEIRGQGLQIPCVLITGGLSEKPEGISNLGFLRKPFEIDELEALCHSMIKDSH